MSGKTNIHYDGRFTKYENPVSTSITCNYSNFSANACILSDSLHLRRATVEWMIEEVINEWFKRPDVNYERNEVLEPLGAWLSSHDVHTGIVTGITVTVLRMSDLNDNKNTLFNLTVSFFGQRPGMPSGVADVLGSTEDIFTLNTVERATIKE